MIQFHLRVERFNDVGEGSFGEFPFEIGLGYLTGIELLVETECFEKDGVRLFPCLLQQFRRFCIFVRVELVGLGNGIES
jgi:hypothetical protein